MEQLRFVFYELRSPSAEGASISEVELFGALGQPVRITTASSPGVSARGQGPTNAADGTLDSKWVSLSYANNSSSSELWLTPAEAVQLSGYRLTTSNDAPKRDPVSWRVEGRPVNGATWELIEERIRVHPPTLRYARYDDFWSVAPPPPPRTSPEIRVAITQARSKDASETALSEIRFFTKNGPAIIQQVVNPGGKNPPGEGPENVIDGNIKTKWLDANFNASNPSELLLLLTPDQSEVISYEFATAGDGPTRDPTSWRISVREVAGTWKPLDAQSFVNAPKSRYAAYASISLLDDVPLSEEFRVSEFSSANAEEITVPTELEDLNLASASLSVSPSDDGGIGTAALVIVCVGSVLLVCLLFLLAHRRGFLSMIAIAKNSGSKPPMMDGSMPPAKDGSRPPAQDDSGPPLQPSQPASRTSDGAARQRSFPTKHPFWSIWSPPELFRRASSTESSTPGDMASEMAEVNSSPETTSPEAQRALTFNWLMREEARNGVAVCADREPEMTAVAGAGGTTPGESRPAFSTCNEVVQIRPFVPQIRAMTSPASTPACIGRASGGVRSATIGSRTPQREGQSPHRTWAAVQQLPAAEPLSESTWANVARDIGEKLAPEESMALRV